MPSFDVHCTVCDSRFELLVRTSSVPLCPGCGSADIIRQLSAPPPSGKTTALLQRARTQAAREGHFSNYRRAELAGKLK
jgi:putative FmdB family regulatory protein